MEMGISKGEFRENMKCSIIIPYSSRSDRTVRLFESLENQDFDESEYELIFVNRGGNNGLERYINEHGAKVSTVCLSSPDGGVGQAKNLGLQRASGELIIFLNGDEMVPQYFVSGHYNGYKKSDKPVMQFGLTKQVFEGSDRSYYDNRELFRNGIRYWLTEPERYGLDKQKNYYYIKDIRLEMLEPYSYDFDKVKYKMIFTKTSNLSVPMECIKRFGGFEENYKGEEIDDWEFGYRMMKNNVDIVYNPRVEVFRLYEKERYDSKRFSEWKNNLDSMLKKYNDSFLNKLSAFTSVFDPESRERCGKSEPGRNIWLDAYKDLELNAR